MLILAEGTVHTPLAGPAQFATAAWLGPMVDEGVLQSGWLDEAGGRVLMVLSFPDLAEAQQRLGDLPASRDGSVSFRVTPVTALRFR